MVLWILLEVLLIPDRSVIEVIYGFMGRALAVLSLTPSVRSHLSLRR